jgi:hypothetical protein
MNIETLPVERSSRDMKRDKFIFKTNHQNFHSRRQFPGTDLKSTVFVIMKH